jgi:glutathione S-transferase
LVSSEIHPAIGFRFYPVSSGGELEVFREKRIQAKLSYLNDKELKGKSYLVGNSFTVADSYLYIVLTWLKPGEIDAFPVVKSYFEGIKALPFVVEAHAKMATNPATT